MCRKYRRLGCWNCLKFQSRNTRFAYESITFLFAFVVVALVSYSLSLSIYIYIYIYIYLSIHLSLSIYISRYLFLYLSIYLSLSPSLSLSLSISVSISLSISLSLLNNRDYKELENFNHIWISNTNSIPEVVTNFFMQLLHSIPICHKNIEQNIHLKWPNTLIITWILHYILGLTEQVQ